MAFLRLVLIGAAITASFMADAQSMDDMTPDEIAREFGLPTEAEFPQYLESHPELMFTPAGGSILIDIQVSIPQQRIYVSSPEGQWVDLISSGIHSINRNGPYTTKRGCFTPYHMSRMHYSKKYDNAPMPNSLFYFGGFAIHETYEVRKLGRPASHGCVRTTKRTAAAIYDLVSRYGRENTQVCVD